MMVRDDRSPRPKAPSLLKVEVRSIEMHRGALAMARLITRRLVALDVGGDVT